MFELNIEKYNMNELLELFSINTNELYDITTINNKYQILISSVIGFIYYILTRNEVISIVIVLILSYSLRKIKIDMLINNKLDN